MKNDRGRHTRNGPLAGSDGIDLTTRHPINIPLTRLGGEIVHFVIQDNSGPGNGKFRAEDIVDGERAANRIARSINDTHLSSAVILGYRFRWENLSRWVLRDWLMVLRIDSICSGVSSAW